MTTTIAKEVARRRAAKKRAVKQLTFGGALLSVFQAAIVASTSANQAVTPSMTERPAATSPPMEPSGTCSSGNDLS